MTSGIHDSSRYMLSAGVSPGPVLRYNKAEYGNDGIKDNLSSGINPAFFLQLIINAILYKSAILRDTEERLWQTIMFQ